MHRAVVSHHATGRIALDLHPGDGFWCTADAGRVAGADYGQSRTLPGMVKYLGARQAAVAAD